MSRTDHILAAIQRRIERYRAFLDGEGDLRSVMIIVKLRPNGVPRATILSPEIEETLHKPCSEGVQV